MLWFQYFSKDFNTMTSVAIITGGEYVSRDT